MGVPGATNLLLAQKNTDLQIERSLRFNPGDSAFLSRTPSTASNLRTWTISFWYKRQPGNHCALFEAATSGAQCTIFWMDAADNLYFQSLKTTVQFNLKTIQVFRDPSAWMHIVLAVDTTQATASDRAKIYVNGSQITAFDSPSYPAQNYDTHVNDAITHGIGRRPFSGGDIPLSGYLAEVNFVDGQALGPTSFGVADATTGSWQPRQYSGAYGSNGYRLTFADNSAATAAALGKDTSGNGNNWTPNNFSAGVLGTPTIYTPPTGFSVWADTFGTGVGSITYSDGNKSGTASATSEKTVLTSSAKSSGKWYIEFVRSGVFDSADEVWGLAANNAAFPGSAGTNGIGTAYTRSVFNSLGSGTSATPSIPFFTSGAVCQLAVDFDSKKVWWGVDNVWSSSGNPSTGSNPTFSAWSGTPTWYAAQRLYYTSNKASINFGNATALIQTDSYVDTPVSYGLDTGLGGEARGNYCTLNPIDQLGSNAFSNGNLDVQTDLGTAASVCATFAVTSGKWYWEVRNDNGSASMIGIADYGRPLTARRWNSDGAWFYYAYQGDKYFNSAPSAYGAAYTTGDIIGIALDMDSGSVTFYKNGASQGVAFSSGLAGKLIGPCLGNGTSSFGMIYKCNFGQRAFVYGAPSGYKCLCSMNLPEPLIAKGSSAMDVRLYTGNGGTQAISGLSFSPDLVWIKQRSGTEWHGLFDAVRGAGKVVFSNSSQQEATGSGLNSFDSAGFTVGSQAYVNGNSIAMASWVWDAGSTTASNNSGSISSQVRANASAGFSVVTYTGNNDNGSATVGHGLGVAPQFIIAKKRSGAGNSMVGHRATTQPGNLRLNTTDQLITSFVTNAIGSSSSSTFLVYSYNNGVLADNLNDNGATYVAYCFAPVAGYSSFGGYIGNASADGPMVWLGFRPRWILFKNVNSNAEDWWLHDTARNTFNVMTSLIIPNSSTTEVTNVAHSVDALSNGFKVRTSAQGVNGSGHTIIYAAFAESPFKYARAR